VSKSAYEARSYAFSALDFWQQFWQQRRRTLLNCGEHRCTRCRGLERLQQREKASEGAKNGKQGVQLSLISTKKAACEGASQAASLCSYG